MEAQREQRYRKWAYAALGGVLALSLFFAYQLTQIGFDYDFERFFPQGDPETEFFLKFREQYGSENDFILFSLTNDEGIFEEEFLLEAKRLQDSLETLSYVVSVQSLLNQNELIVDPVFGSVFERPYLRFEEPEQYGRDSTRIFDSPELINSFITEDATAMALVLTHEPFLAKLKCDTLAAEVVRVCEGFEFDRLYKSGRALGQKYFVERMQTELMLFISVSLIFIVLFLVIAFRSAWGVVVPLIVVFMAIIWLVGFMQATGKQIDLLLTILPTILFVVGMSDVVHILSKYYDELRKGYGKLDSIRTAIREVGLATFLTSLTTSIGFLTLLSSSIIPIREFGLYSAVGVFMAYILAFTLLPATMILFPSPPLRGEGLRGGFWNKKLHSMLLWLIKERRMVGWGSLVLVLICGWGVSRIEVNNYLLEDLRKDNPMRVEFDYFEKAYAGVRPFELAISLSDTSRSVLEPDVLRQLDRLDEYLREEYGAGFILSPVTAVKALNKANHNGKGAYYKLPEKDSSLKRLTRNLERAKDTEVAQMLLHPQLHSCRFTGKIGDWGNQVISQKNADLERFMAEEMDSELIQHRLTGTATLIDLNNDYLSRTMIGGLLIAFLVVALIVGLMYKDVKMVFIALVPNVLPLMMIGAVMGFSGIDLKVSTSIIFTIAFGIAVDDTIHFISRMRLELAAGRHWLYALKRSFISTGKAIIITSLILVAGFFTLILSTFKGTFYTGLLLSLTLLFAVLADLLVLPILFWMFYRKKTVEIEKH